MKPIKLDNLTVEQLVERFTVITLDQDKALRSGRHAQFNRLFEDMEAVKQELKARDGDQRRALLPLYEGCEGDVGSCSGDRIKNAKDNC